MTEENKKNNSGKNKELYRTNQEIQAPTVRVVGEGFNQIMTLEEALNLAQQEGLDLVEIAPNADPPVCKISDYSKLKYEHKKREKELKKKQQVVEVKEIRFGPNTDDHDFAFKLKHAIEFIQKGNKVKCYVQFHGRSIVYKERGEELLKRFAEEIAAYAKVEIEPKLEGKRMFMILVPNKTKKN
ncbi:MAG: translation initiation factor IF-3 [Bacteroidia bacterium]|nr:translation initiation factor IF-3 [Bacteroidia bacterium]MDW8345733.1 translation initiation factor IF-3 [Bacteroidia bacterium]